MLGDGGATTALREAARALGIALEVRRRAELDAPVRGACVWTWPAHLEVPASASLRGRAGRGDRLRRARLEARSRDPAPAEATRSGSAPAGSLPRPARSGASGRTRREHLRLPLPPHHLRREPRPRARRGDRRLPRGRPARARSDPARARSPPARAERAHHRARRARSGRAALRPLRGQDARHARSRRSSATRTSARATTTSSSTSRPARATRTRSGASASSTATTAAAAGPAGARRSRRVIGGAVAEAFLARELPKLSVVGWVSQVGTLHAPVPAAGLTRATVDAHPTRCPDPATAETDVRRRSSPRRRQGDSLGGTIDVRVEGLPVGLGEPVFGKLKALLAQALGLGRHGERRRVGTAGAARGDSRAAGQQLPRATRESYGGIQGGMSNGEPVLIRALIQAGRRRSATREEGPPRSLHPPARGARARGDDLARPRRPLPAPARPAPPRMNAPGSHRPLEGPLARARPARRRAAEAGAGGDRRVPRAAASGARRSAGGEQPARGGSRHRQESRRRR